MIKFFKNFFVNLELNRLKKRVEKINHLEPKVKKMSKEEILKRSLELKDLVQKGESEDDILEEAFALVREASVRTLGQRPFDVQLMGGIVLHQGKIAEMLTGEGKTLTATAPAYLNALKGKGVHIITVNDYLAKRDTVWMGQIYHFLGLKVACLVHELSFQYDPEYTREKILGKELEKIEKERDILGGFKVFEEFLRPISRKEAYQADIIYGTNHEFGFDYLKDNLVLSLEDRVQKGHYYAIIDEVDSILIDEARTPLIISAPDKQSSEYYKIFAKVVEKLEPDKDYIVEEKQKAVNITEAGIEKVEKILGLQNLYDLENLRLVHYLQESLKAKALFHRDKDYVVRNGEVVIVDEFTGRLLFGRRYSGGLHQAIEAKEGVKIKEENRIFAQITIQNYFRLYEKIAGMTGTAQTSAEEFHKVYNLEVVSIPPNKPMIRKDLPDVIYKTKEAKYKAVVAEIKKRYEKGQPVLVGTTSITNNEILSQYLTKAGIPHHLLNAKNHEKEGEIIAQAGKLKAVTVATNMAGRGVDIILGGNPPDPQEAQKVKELGGLHVIGTERHEARRIDDQLRGRAGRQGDPGSSQFFLSLEDDLLRIFGGEKVKELMESFNLPDDLPIESEIVSQLVFQAQKRVEGINFDLRRYLLDFDDVLNKQRNFIYQKRIEFLEAGEKNEIKPIIEKIFQNQNKNLEKIPQEFTKEQSILIAQQLVRLLDILWMDHLENLEFLKESIGLRAYAHQEPIVEYRKEAHALFSQLKDNFNKNAPELIEKILEINPEAIKIEIKTQEPPKSLGKIGRNDPCWCGSGKKYKKCHGR